ncbi:hypothetical protein C8Q75DRAFT_749877 [Abortiporus biennis]|nr:hypothetical protein C8Q75DRAFT_749877 [Abortiporus biennis]
MVLRGRRRIRFSEVPPPSISHVTRRRRTTMKDFTTTGLDSPVPATTSVAPSNFTTPHTTGLNERNNSNPAVPNLDQTPLSVMSTALNCGTPLTVDSTLSSANSDQSNAHQLSGIESPINHIQAENVNIGSHEYLQVEQRISCCSHCSCPPRRLLQPLFCLLCNTLWYSTSAFLSVLGFFVCIWIAFYYLQFLWLTMIWIS